MAQQLRVIIPSLLAIIAFLIVACNSGDDAAQTQICINTCNQDAQNAQQNNQTPPDCNVRCGTGGDGTPGNGTQPPPVNDTNQTTPTNDTNQTNQTLPILNITLPATVTLQLQQIAEARGEDFYVQLKSIAANIANMSIVAPGCTAWPSDSQPTPANCTIPADTLNLSLTEDDLTAFTVHEDEYAITFVSANGTSAGTFTIEIPS